ncbi:cell division protein FtsI/penicillin-binding protein 2 [Corynebacterium kutscheri]|uniref:Cell division protein FtsI/penicillin-binding protein 2 n=1 Tax=Corynebacterium kutscheri TaxID=35755 RepID=A0A0F6TDA8_9CORY|nr:cell division protein FtsI/penicillin-binding protein 2 [Corynebacterium kutscheri]VEH09890.1 Penicillin-binding protein [Corynebacterium kutscheri]
MTRPQSHGRDPYAARRRRQDSLRTQRADELGLKKRVNAGPQKSKEGQKALNNRRLKIAGTLIIAIVTVLIGRLALVQLWWGPSLSDLAAQQRTRVYVDAARRGEILDRNGQQLAYTMQSRSLTVSPTLLRSELRHVAEIEMRNSGEFYQVSGQARESRITDLVSDYLKDYSEEIPKIIDDASASTSEVNSEDILKKLESDSSYEVLVRNVDPDIAQQIAQEYHGVAADLQNIRQYPNGAIAENVLGKISYDGQGQFGFEASNDALLSGIDGRSTVDVSTNGQVIPGTTRDTVPATNGATARLTLDLDLQTYVQQQIEQAVANSGAQSGEAVVLDVETGEVLAMANSDTIDPMGDIQRQIDQGKDFSNTSISAPFEPGSVAKIITAAGVIEDGLSTPDEVIQVPGSINMSGVTVKDAWDHGVVGYTTTGIFGKSSNVGTLLLAQRLGEQRFNDLLNKFGIGQTTGIELPSESQGLVPDISQWSGGTFANLPIGQGMSWTTLQMASVYQAIANEGVRIQPRIIDRIVDASGSVIEQPEPTETKVVSAQTARTIIDMFRAVAQNDPTGVQSGTGPGAAIDGYQVSGKTGTAQQVDPATGAYSNSNYWITFAGIAPADDPRYVVAIQLDRPVRGVHGEGGQSAAPLFHDIATWLLNRDNVPLSPPMEGTLVLQAQ